jgi:hypothetical protein
MVRNVSNISREYASVQKQCKIMQIRVATPAPRVSYDVNINSEHIRDVGGSIGRLRHLKHHRGTQAMVVHTACS